MHKQTGPNKHCQFFSAGLPKKNYDDLNLRELIGHAILPNLNTFNLIIEVNLKITAQSFRKTQKETRKLKSSLDG